MRRARHVAILALTGIALGACGGGKDATGPTINFPSLPNAIVANMCIRSDKAVNDGINGTLAATDCPFGDGSYYEAYRVRVATAGTYTFSANSTFDNLLAVLRLDATVLPQTGPQNLLAWVDSGTATPIAANDDRVVGNTNALISGVPLQDGTDYLLVVNGYSSTDVGPYTVAFTKP